MEEGVAVRVRERSARLVLSIVAVFALMVTAVTAPTGSQAHAAVAVCDGNNHLDDAFADNSTFGGPVIGVRWTAAVTQTISGAQIFTARSTEPLALGIWTDAAGKPGTALAFTDYFPLTLEPSWQGASFVTPVDVTAGMTYWLVIDPPTSGSVPNAPSGIVQPYWGSFTGDVTGGATWFGPFQGYAWKFRFFCGTPSLGDLVQGRPGRGLENAPGLQRSPNEHMPLDRITSRR